jgi:hypothetical protein
LIDVLKTDTHAPAAADAAADAAAKILLSVSAAYTLACSEQRSALILY